MTIENEVPCVYCNLNRGEDTSEHFIRMMKNEVISVYLHRDQSLPGRIVIASHEHFSDITEMPADTSATFFREVHCMSKAIRQAYPETVKINLALSGNAPEMRHPHIHLLPRHIGDRHWPYFQLDYQLPYWPDNDPRYSSTITKILFALADGS